jgi:hypothetical protein
LAAEAEARRV